MGKKNAEISFLVEQAVENRGCVAWALEHSIVTEADGLDALNDAIREAVRCHFDDTNRPKAIRLHFVRQEDPFSCFEEWASEPDSNAYATL